MEFWRKKNTDTRVYFPIQKNDGTFITSAASLDSEFILYGAHGSATPSFADCAHEAVEVGASGIYLLDVSAAELNDDYGTLIQIKSSSSGEIVQVLLFHTRPNEVDVVNWKGSAAAAMTGDAFARLGAPTGVSQAADAAAVKADTSSLLKGRYNRNDTNPTTGAETVYEDDSTTVHKSGPAYEDIAGTMPFDGNGANRRDRMT